MQCKTHALWKSVTTAAAAAILAMAVGSARAGQLAISVRNLQVSPSTVCSGEPIVVSYDLAGAGFTVGGVPAVKIEILNGTTPVKTFTYAPPDQGALKGANTVNIDPTGIPAGGPYSVRVSVTASQTFNPTTWARVSDPDDPAVQFFSPRGVDVNRNPSSPYFGRIYVSEGLAGAVTGRETADGIYVLYPDLSMVSPNALGRGVAGSWTTSSNSPFRVTVGPDDQLYIADWSDSHSGVFIADPEVSAVTDLLIYPNPDGGARATSGLVTNAAAEELYGSVHSVWVEGTGAARKVFTIDEDVSAVPNEFPSTPLILRYDIPGGTTKWANRPALHLDDGDAAGLFNNDYMDMVRDAAGNTYVTDMEPDVALKFDPSGNLVSQILNGVEYRGLAIDEPRNRIALATGDGRVLLADKSFTTATEIITGLGGTNRDIAFDAEGWIYVVNSSSERLHVYAPPGNYTVTGGASTATNVVRIASSGGGVPGDMDGDGDVDLQDAVRVVRKAAGLL